MYFLHKEQTTRWCTEAQHAVCRRSWLADCHHQWRMAAYLDVRSTAASKLAVASLCWQQIHLLWSADIQAQEMRGWQHLSQVHTVTLTVLWRTTLSDLHRVAHNNTTRHANCPRDGA